LNILFEPPPDTAFLSEPPLRFVILALSKLVSVNVQNYRLALSKLAPYNEDSLKLEFSKSPSLMSALDSLALQKLQSLATDLTISTCMKFALIKVLLLKLASLKFAFLKFDSLKLQFYKLAFTKLTSCA